MVRLLPAPLRLRYLPGSCSCCRADAAAQDKADDEDDDEEDDDEGRGVGGRNEARAAQVVWKRSLETIWLTKVKKK